MIKGKQNHRKNRDKKHIDCAWFLSSPDGFLCCDVRSPFHEKGIPKTECENKACQHFHERKVEKVDSPN